MKLQKLVQAAKSVACRVKGHDTAVRCTPTGYDKPDFFYLAGRYYARCRRCDGLVTDKEYRK